MKHTQKPFRAFFETLGNENRWRIVELLEKKPIRAGDIARALNIEQSLVSHHVKRLTTCGFVHVRSSGRERIYSINHATMRPLLALMRRHIERYCGSTCPHCSD